ncbi:MAG: hypothetical protein NZ693_04030, partial [Thermoflexales bacterium]|nr:hypothetical protein [Thermoflexales bacterium]
GWILELFRADGVAASAKEPAHDQLVLAGELRAQLKLIRHRRNGLHPCMQVHTPGSGAAPS